MNMQTVSDRLKSRSVARVATAPVLLAAVFALAVEANAAQDSAALSDYRPAHQVSGVIRTRGNDEMATLMDYWEKGFRKYQPNIQFDNTLKGTASGIYGLEMRTADIAVMGRPINPFERYGSYERSWAYPVEIEVATGSAQALHKSPAFAVFVNKDNPLSKLTIRQLDRIFGGQRSGGWQALSWVEAAARPASQNIRTWGQLGLGGDLADKPIHVYGPPLLGAGVITFFQARVLQGSDMWNEDLREYVDRRRMTQDLSKDPYGIAYAPIAYQNAGVKAVALAESDAGPFVDLSKKSVADRSYPLARPVYIDYSIDNEKSELADPRVDPKVKEFLSYILSKQGQQEVVREGVYLPLPATVTKDQLKKLNSQEFPAEKLLLGE